MNTGNADGGKRTNRVSYKNGKKEYTGKNKSFHDHKDGKKEFRSHLGGKSTFGGKNKPRSNYYDYDKKEEEIAPKRDSRPKSTKDTKSTGKRKKSNSKKTGAQKSPCQTQNSGKAKTQQQY